MAKTIREDFAVFIITNGRPDNIRTISSLDKHGYTGPIYLIVDNLDKTQSKYIEIYGDQVIIFDKPDVYSRSEPGNNFNDLRSTTFPRNACFDIAKDLGLTYFLVLDDDYTAYQYRFDNKYKYCGTALNNMDTIFMSILEFYIKSGITSVAMSQGGEFLNGNNSLLGKSIRTKRKCMNSFFCSVDRPFEFIGQLNEDVNTYLVLGSRGHVFLTLGQVSLVQVQTQASSGGMTDIYLDSGTYVKSFYSVMYQPSAVKVVELTTRKNQITTNKRLHHRINWNCAVPKILNEKHKKNLQDKTQ